MKKARATVLTSNAVRLKIQQLQNDLAAAKSRARLFEETNENFRRNHSEQSNELVKAYRDRDDWRDAFKLIMRLVK